MQLQSHFDIIGSWPEVSQIKFDIDIYNVLHIRNSNHYRNGSELSKLSHEKKLRVTISNDLKHCKHCLDVVKTANKLVGFIRV